MPHIGPYEKIATMTIAGMIIAYSCHVRLRYAPNGSVLLCAADRLAPAVFDGFAAPRLASCVTPEGATADLSDIASLITSSLCLAYIR
ncbi:hypothetical protein BBSC_0041 [Bifidobacterium scardovii JCM 12489 = DSM 13734]|nr:hypothetical protein BBSC_0041 [Bifidobacterium scardovii JCM 12489 = DSM 13734]